MKKLIAAALCTTAIGAQALEIKGRTVGELVDCEKFSGHNRKACKTGLLTVRDSWRTTFLGRVVTLTAIIDNQRVDSLWIYLGKEARWQAVEAYTKKYGKPRYVKEEYRASHDGFERYCNAHQWRKPGKLLEVWACIRPSNRIVDYGVSLERKAFFNKSDI